MFVARDSLAPYLSHMTYLYFLSVQVDQQALVSRRGEEEGLYF